MTRSCWARDRPSLKPCKAIWFWASANTFYILTGSGGLSGAFTNVGGGRVSTTDGAGSFAVTYTATQVVLSDYQATLLQAMALPEIDSSEDPPDAKAKLLRYALGAGASPNAHLPPVIERLGDRLAIKFTRHQADVSYIVEATSDLQNWEIIEQDPGNIGEEVTIADTVDISATKPPQRFMRIRVVQP